MIRLPAKDIPVCREFIDPKTGLRYVMLAHDHKTGECLAQDADGEHWECKGHEEMELTPETETDGKNRDNRRSG